MDPTFRSLARAHEDGGESHAVFLVAAVVVSLTGLMIVRKRF